MSLIVVSWGFSSPCLSWPLVYISWRKWRLKLLKACQFSEWRCLFLVIELEESEMFTPYWLYDLGVLYLTLWLAYSLHQ